MNTDIEELLREELKNISADGPKYISVLDESDLTYIVYEEDFDESEDEVHRILVYLCDKHNYVLESNVLTSVIAILGIIADDGIDKEEFDVALALMKGLTNGIVDDDYCKAKIKKITLAKNYKVNDGWFGTWFSSIDENMIEE